MGLMLLGVIAIVAVACVLMPEIRFAVGVTAVGIVAIIALYVVSDLARSFRELSRSNEASKRIPAADVTVDDLELSGTPHAYKLSGTVHNHNATYTLGLVRFGMLLEDCVPNGCRTEGTGHGEAIRSVPPNQAARFTTQAVTLPQLLPPLGQRRITARVYLTMSGY